MIIKNKTIAKIFSGAKLYLSDGKDAYDCKYSYICWAIEEFCEETDIGLVSERGCKEIITDRLGADNLSLEEWLISNGINSTPSLDTIKLQATRLAWLDSLVEEFDKDGYYTNKE